MKIEYSILTLAAGLFLVAYKKDSTETKKDTIAKQLFRTSMKNAQAVQYNADGKPITITWEDAGYAYKKAFSYDRNKIHYMVTRNSEKTEQGDYTLTDGKISSLEWSSLGTDGKTENQYTESFVYNEKGLLEKHRFNDTYSAYTYDKHNNLVQTLHYNAKGQATRKVEYTYTTIKDLAPEMGYFNGDGSGFFLPPFAQQLVASKKVTRIATGEVTLKGKFSYVLDEDGYPLTVTWTALTAGDLNYTWTNSFQ